LGWEINGERAVHGEGDAIGGLEPIGVDPPPRSQQWLRRINSGIRRGLWRTAAAASSED
jgi:hypothetical protein